MHNAAIVISVMYAISVGIFGTKIHRYQGNTKFFFPRIGSYNITYDERVTNSLKVMRENSNIDNTYEVPNTVLSELPEELQDCYKKVTEIKKEVMEKAITGQTTVDEAMSEYHQKADVYLKKILEALNNKG